VGPDLFGIDKGIFLWVYELPLPTLPVEIVTHLSTLGGVWLLMAAYLLIFRKGLDRKTGLALGVGLLAHVVLVDFALKHLVARERPFRALGVELRDRVLDPETYSFPSGHTLVAFLAVFVLGARFPKARKPLLAVAILVALSRVHLGCHYPSDVFVGAALGVAIGVAVVTAFRIMTDKEVEMHEGDRPAVSSSTE
jgi:undecaprenyl-diphosphatase